MCHLFRVEADHLHQAFESDWRVSMKGVMWDETAAGLDMHACMCASQHVTGPLALCIHLEHTCVDFVVVVDNNPFD